MRSHLARPGSWAASAAEAEARRRDARALVGEYVRGVRYYTLDYRRDDLHPDLTGSGPRRITDPVEWADPTWLFEGADSMDFGLEILTASGGVYSVTWDLPGQREGIGLQPMPLLGSEVSPDSDLAIWEVGEGSPAWKHLIGTRIAGVDLRYQPWDEEQGSLWCPRIILQTDGGDLDIVLAEVEHGVLRPSANNIAVLHPGQPLSAEFANCLAEDLRPLRHAPFA